MEHFILYNYGQRLTNFTQMNIKIIFRLRAFALAFWFRAAYETERLASLALLHTITKAKMHFMTPYALRLAHPGGCMVRQRIVAAQRANRTVI